MPAKRSRVIERPKECKLDNPDWSINVTYDDTCPSLPAVPILNESTRAEKLAMLGVKQDRSLDILEKVYVNKVVNVLKKYERGQEFLSLAVDNDKEYHLNGKEMWKDFSREDKKALLPVLDLIKGGVKQTVRLKCPEIVAKVEAKRQARIDQDNDRGMGYSRGW